MASYKPREIASSLLRKGFRPEEGGNHTKFHLVVDGRDSGVVTFLDRHEREYSDFRLHLIAKELGLRSGDLKKLIDCPLSYDGLVELLKQTGEL